MTRTNALLLAMLLAVAAGSPGCLPKAKAQTVTTPGGTEINTRALRMRLYQLTAQLAGEAESASNRIQAECDDPQIYRNALLFKTELIPMIHRASFRPDPLLSAVDVWLLTVQVRNYLIEGEGREMFGPQQPIAVDAVRRMDALVDDFLQQHERPQGDKADHAVEAFAREHPIGPGPISGRATAITPLTEHFKGSKMGAMKAVGSMVESIDDLSDRMAIYAQQLPKQARWEAELTMLDKGVDEIDSNAITEDLNRIRLAADRLAVFLDDAPTLIDEQVRLAIPHIERVIAEADIDRFRIMADELAEDYVGMTLAALTSEREAVLEAVTLERELVMQDAARLIVETTDRTFERVESQIDAQVARLMPLAIAALVGPFVLGLLVGAVFMRRRA